MLFRNEVIWSEQVDVTWEIIIYKTTLCFQITSKLSFLYSNTKTFNLYQVPLNSTKSCLVLMLTTNRKITHFTVQLLQQYQVICLCLHFLLMSYYVHRQWKSFLQLYIFCNWMHEFPESKIPFFVSPSFAYSAYVGVSVQKWSLLQSRTLARNFLPLASSYKKYFL